MTVKWQALSTFNAAFAAQTAFCADASRIVIANAAIRTGKTYSAARKFLARVRTAMNTRPRDFKTFWVIAPTYEEGIAQKIELAALIPPHQVDTRRQGDDGRWRNLKQGGGKVWLRANTLIEFKSADRPEGLVARKVDGVWWTEIARSKYAAWPNVRGRLSNTNGWLIADTSPFGHGWVYNDLLKPAYDGAPNAASVHRWTALDSPFIPAAEVEAARATLPKTFFERDYMASDDVFAGQIYDVDDSLHLQPVCPFTPERAVLAADVNTTGTHPAEFVWALVRGGGLDVQVWVEGAYKKVIGLDYSLYATDIAQHAADLKRRFPRVDVVIDPSMHTELKQLLRARGVAPLNAVNDVLPGVRTLGSALMPGAGQPRLTFGPAAREAMAQLKVQRWVMDGDGVVRAKPDKALDDGWADCLRYLAMHVFRGYSAGQLR